MHSAAAALAVFLAGCALALLLIPFLGQNFFPSSDNGSFILHVRAKAGTRIEETARLCDLVEQSIRRRAGKIVQAAARPRLDRAHAQGA